MYKRQVQDRLVVLGNDAKAQKTAITKGAGILIVVWSDSIDDEVLELAKLHHCPIIISGHGTMNTSRYLYFSPSVKLLMKRDVVSFNMDEFVEDVGKKMLKTRYRSYPVEMCIRDRNSCMVRNYPTTTFRMAMQRLKS